MFYVVRFLIDIAYVLALFAGYFLGQKIGMKYMFTDLYVANLYCGLIGITCVVAVFRVLRGTIFFLLKATSLYAIATGAPPGEAFRGTMKHFGRIVGVASITKLLTEAVSDVKAAMTDESSGPSLTEIFPILEALPLAGLVNLAGRYYTKSFTYLDECVLAYSFAIDKPLAESVKEAFTEFLKQSVKIMGRLAVANVVVSIVNVLLFVMGCVLYFNKMHFSIPGFIVFYILMRAIMYVVDDAFVQPCLLQQVTSDYVSNISTAADSFKEDMEGLNRFVTDDAQEDDETTKQTADGAEASLSAEFTRLFELPAVKRLMQLSNN